MPKTCNHLLERSATGLAVRVRGQKCVNLLLKHALLESGEELFRFNERQAQVLDALAVLLQGDDVGHGFFTAIIGAHDELKFDMHGELLRFGSWVDDAGYSTGVGQ